MWLINTQSLALQEFVDPSSVEYAILSHTWEDEEVTFQDINNLEQSGVRLKTGFSKIVKTCEIARQMDLRFAWVDTCCIDKSSSAELSEAINSMFSWYKHSTVCFVFLSDLPALENSVLQPNSARRFPYSQETFGACRWFSRGWTLQELIAPDHVEFFNSRWEQFCRKYDCLEILSDITGISRSVLKSSSSLRRTPIAVKMSWAASRQTKRIEDRAYSLLGIFDINMPMIYGEGHKAFRRLQEEVARETNDLSLFAWRAALIEGGGAQVFRGIFARSPAEFSTCSGMRRSSTGIEPQREFTLTNKGVRFETKLYKHTQGAYVMYLGFTIHGNVPVCIFLKRTVDGFIRSEPWSMECEETIADVDKHRGVFTVYVQKEVSLQEDLGFQKRMHRSFRISIGFPTSLKLETIEPSPEYLWDRFHSTFISNDPDKSFAAKLHIVVRGTDGTFNETFPLTLTLGWTSTLQKPFAVLYGTEQSTKMAKRSIQNVPPSDFPDLVKDDVDWERSHENEFEHTISRVCLDPRLQSKEVHFIDGKMMVLHRGIRKSSAWAANFKVELETHEGDNGVVTYCASLSGELAKLEGRDAVMNAYSYVPGRLEL
ncbi:HET domain-containing protein [Colletotrichum musicola]|uniref:HET domain-containing protein n=1 Tax=Colletotrichum musicola TaxID=2175873 RepID=A0A8H6K9S3_9PEZI|nr:HET domain-containing protein [Colletotrichum musicola]